MNPRTMAPNGEPGRLMTTTRMMNVIDCERRNSSPRRPRSKTLSATWKPSSGGTGMMFRMKNCSCARARRTRTAPSAGGARPGRVLRGRQHRRADEREEQVDRGTGARDQRVAPAAMAEVPAVDRGGAQPIPTEAD